MTSPDDLIKAELRRRSSEINDRFDEARARLGNAQSRLDETQVKLTTQLHKLVDLDKPISTPARPGRERILEHARDLFLQRGFLDVSMREIAEAAGLRKASIYHHFRDKEALFTAIALEEVSWLRSQMAASIEGISSLPDCLETLAFTQFTLVRSGSMRIAHDFRDHIPESRHAEMHQELHRLSEIYRGVFDAALTRGEIQNIEPSFAAASFFQIVLSWTWDFPTPDIYQGQDPRILAKTAVRLLLYGCAGPALPRPDAH